MNPLDLEEAQGLTIEMMQAWLKQNGWTLAPAKPDCSGYTAPGLFWSTGRYSFWGYGTAAIETIREATGMTPQAILREMNPRMRPGVPSAEAHDAHRSRGGIWFAAHGEIGRGGSICLISFYGDDGLEHEAPFVIWDGDEWLDAVYLADVDLSEWFFWPCDAAGNKVRWPTNDKGAML